MDEIRVTQMCRKKVDRNDRPNHFSEGRMFSQLEPAERSQMLEKEKMSLREDQYLQSGGGTSTENLALSLNVTAEEKFFDKTGCESCHQKGNRLDGILCNHRVKSRGIVLERSRRSQWQNRSTEKK
jgi:hypothetical protein